MMRTHRDRKRLELNCAPEQRGLHAGAKVLCIVIAVCAASIPLGPRLKQEAPADADMSLLSAELPAIHGQELRADESVESLGSQIGRWTQDERDRLAVQGGWQIVLDRSFRGSPPEAIEFLSQGRLLYIFFDGVADTDDVTASVIGLEIDPRGVGRTRRSQTVGFASPGQGGRHLALKPLHWMLSGVHPGPHTIAIARASHNATETPSRVEQLYYILIYERS